MVSYTAQRIEYQQKVFFGELAQLGERIAGSDEVRGSIPLFSIRVWRENGRDVVFMFFLVTLMQTIHVECLILMVRKE